VVVLAILLWELLVVGVSVAVEGICVNDLVGFFVSC
jgi:hypothetical protein